MKHLFPFGLLALAACISSSQEPVSYRAVSVLAPNGAVATQNGWTITVTRASIGLGPFYFCAAATGSSTLCDSSAAELADVAYVDALAPSSPLGTVNGFTGVIKSATYDFGISWFDTETAATPAPILPDGHSMHIEGTATNGTSTVTIIADVDVDPQYQGQNAIATAPADTDVTSSATELQVVLSPAGWLRQLDFDAIAKSGPEPFVIAPGMPEHTAIVVGLKNLAQPTFQWVAP